MCATRVFRIESIPTRGNIGDSVLIQLNPGLLHRLKSDSTKPPFLLADSTHVSQSRIKSD